MPLYLEPSTETASLPTASFAFTLRNHTDAALSLGPYAWKVHKHVAGQWYLIGPWAWLLVGMDVKPGGSFTWSLAIDNTDLDRPLTTSLGEHYETIPFHGLGAGKYTFGITGWFNQPQTDHDDEHQLAVASAFELEGKPLALTPTTTPQQIDQDGDTLTVTMPDGSGHTDRPWYEFIVTKRTDPPEAPRRLIIEQIIRETPLRNALAHFDEDVQRVRLITTSLPTFIVSQPQSKGGEKITYIEHETITYEVEAKPPEPSDTPTPAPST